MTKKIKDLNIFRRISTAKGLSDNQVVDMLVHDKGQIAFITKVISLLPSIELGSKLITYSM